MFRLKAYKNDRFYGEKRGKNEVLYMLVQETTKPINIIYNKKTVSLIYKDKKFTEIYTIPIEYYEGEGK